MIQAENLGKKFDKITAVADLTLTVAQGEVLAFLGPNGAGKTTTIRMLAGIITPTSGQAIVAGYVTHKQVEPLHEVIGLLTETPGFYDRLSARRNLEFYASLYSGINVAAQVEKYLRLVGLWERREDKVGTYSKGMKQRLALARALIHEPKVLFMDEPTSGLDPEAAHEVRNNIINLAKQGHTIFLSTHNLAEAEELANRIAIIETRLLALDTAANLRNRLFRRETIIRLDSASESLTEKAVTLPFVKNVRPEENRLIVELEKPEINLPELVKVIVEAGGKILGVSEEEHSLEEIYLKMLQEEKK